MLRCVMVGMSIVYCVPLGSVLVTSAGAGLLSSASSAAQVDIAYGTHSLLSRNSHKFAGGAPDMSLDGGENWSSENR